MVSRPLMKKVLFVDDDPDILALFERQFRKLFAMEVALGPAKGLAALRSGGPYGALVSDMTMPEMNGVEFLRQARQISPDTVRLMLTGNGDQATAVAAVNEGCVFRFLTKPYHPQALSGAIEAALSQYALIVGERELLEKTLNGCVQVLLEIISLIDPQGFGSAKAFRETAVAIAKVLTVDKLWEIEVSAMLSMIGKVAIPPEVVLKARLGRNLTDAEQAMVGRVPEIGSQLLLHVPRLENVAKIVLYSGHNFDGSGFPQDGTAGTDIPEGARILKVAHDLTRWEASGLSCEDALAKMSDKNGCYDLRVLEAAALAAVSRWADGGNLDQQKIETTISISCRDLKVGQMLVSDIVTKAGMLIVSAGTSITPTLLERLRNFAVVSGIKEPIQVRKTVPAVARAAVAFAGHT